MKYSTILFDFDGTLAHSTAAIMDAIRESLTYHGLDFEKHKEIFKDGIGKPMIEIYIKYFGAKKAKEIRKTHIEIQHKHFHKYILLDGAMETLKILKAQGISTAIVTSANRPKMEALVADLKLKDYISYLVTLEDVKEAKPHPEGILKAMRELDAQPSSTLMVGDSEADIRAASHAGIDSVGVTYGTLGKEINKYHPTYTIDSFTDLIKIIRV
ncbi:MAG: HAD-IA family hydrolase [bacterium]